MTPTPEQVESWAKQAEAYSAYCSNPEGLERFAALACAWQRERDAQTAGMFSTNETPIHPDVAWREMSEGTQSVIHMTAQNIAEAIRSDCADGAKG